jgi:hypothetical protein
VGVEKKRDACLRMPQDQQKERASKDEEEKAKASLGLRSLRGGRMSRGEW